MCDNKRTKGNSFNEAKKCDSSNELKKDGDDRKKVLFTKGCFNNGYDWFEMSIIY